MTDTSKDIARFTPSVEFTKHPLMLKGVTGDYVTYNDYAALSAQLEAANARTARARDDALGEAARIADGYGSCACDEDMRNAILALRTQPPAIVEPVTVQEALEFYANKRNWVSTDPYLDAAIDDDEGTKARAALRAIAEAKP